MTKLIPYDAHYLPLEAETYQISIGDASLTARSNVLASEKKRSPPNMSARSRILGAQQFRDDRRYLSIDFASGIPTYRVENETYQ